MVGKSPGTALMVIDAVAEIRCLRSGLRTRLKVRRSCRTGNEFVRTIGDEIVCPIRNEIVRAIGDEIVDPTGMIGSLVRAPPLLCLELFPGSPTGLAGDSGVIIVFDSVLVANLAATLAFEPLEHWFQPFAVWLHFRSGHSFSGDLINCGIVNERPHAVHGP